MERYVYVVFRGYNKAEDIISCLEDTGKLPKSEMIQNQSGRDLPEVTNCYVYESIETLTNRAYSELPLDFYSLFGAESQRKPDNWNGHPEPKFKIGDIVNEYGYLRSISSIIWTTDDFEYRTQNPQHWHYRLVGSNGAIDENEFIRDSLEIRRV